MLGWLDLTMALTLLEVLTELTCAFQKMDHIKIDNFLKENDGEWMIWKRNPPLLTNMAGVSECQIHSTRAILNSLLKTRRSNLSDESLQTLLVEVEAIINACPLTTDVLIVCIGVSMPLKNTNPFCFANTPLNVQTVQHPHIYWFFVNHL